MAPPQSTGLPGSLPVVESEPEPPMVGSVLEPVALPSVVSLPLSAVDALLDAVALEAVVLDAVVEPAVMPPELVPESPDSSTPDRGQPARAASTHTETTGKAAARVIGIAPMDRTDGGRSSTWMKKTSARRDGFGPGGCARRGAHPRWNAPRVCGLFRR